MIHKYTARFDRVGRRRDVPDLLIEARDWEDMEVKLFRYVGKFLISRDYFVFFDLEKGTGAIDAGRFGEFTITPTPGHCSDVCLICGADLKKQGHPFAHQHDVTGATCAYEWEPLP